MDGFFNLAHHAINVVGNDFVDFINDIKENDNLSESEELQLKSCIPNSNEDEKNYKWDIEKAEIILKVLKLKNRGNIKKILSYINQSEYGWQEEYYHFYNTCFYYANHCKFNYGIDNNPEQTEWAFEDIDTIFLHKEYGGITSYLFGYCIASLFSSRLKLDHLQIPYFLQIACERDSNTYRLVQKIVDICDVNTSIVRKCRKSFFQYGYCDYDSVTIFPEKDSAAILDSLLYNRDIPVIIDGYENEKNYTDILRMTANIHRKINRIDIKDRFNILPIFICPVIRSQFKNFFSMDLTNLDIDDEYLKLIEYREQMLASWILEFIINADEYFKKRDTNSDKIRRKTVYERPFFDKLRTDIHFIKKKHMNYTELTEKDVSNIGFLTYFFSQYMKVFENSLRIKYEENFVYRKATYTRNNLPELLERIVDEVTESLFKLHSAYSPTLPMTINVNVISSNKIKEKQVKKNGKKYAADIIKYYQSYGVAIKILPDVEFKDDRYVFSVKLLAGTDAKLISRYADEIRRLLELEFFFTDIRSSSIKIIASKKPLKENSLRKLLESSQFRESKMKIPYAVGYDMLGDVVIADIAEFPHLLIGGTRGSGKSSAVHSLLMSIVCKQKADKVKLLLLDFGASGLKMFEKVPHLLTSVITISEMERGKQCILKLKQEMERRLEKIESIDERYRNKELVKLPFIICVIDEFPAFVRNFKKNSKSVDMFMDLLERARKVKIHLILTAQDATNNNILIKKTNLGAAIAFKCTTQYDSQAIIAAYDAVNLSGKGSMYFKCYQHEGIKRMQGAFMPPTEIMDTLDNIKFDYEAIKKQDTEIDFGFEYLPKLDNSEYEIDSPTPQDIHDEKLAEIIVWSLSRYKISNKQIKDNYEVGYDKANVFLNELESFGIISEQKKGSKLPRTVIPRKIEDISINTINFLEEHGYEKAEIQKAFLIRQE